MKQERQDKNNFNNHNNDNNTKKKQAGSELNIDMADVIHEQVKCVCV